ncbi:MAG: UPF0280 family protein [Pseudomonadota bacterium]
MSGRPTVGWLQGGRLHLQHGPIDLILTVEGPGRTQALQAAQDRFETVLDVLVTELDHLTVSYAGHRFQGPIAQRMAKAVAPLAQDHFVTPMAAVAGAVADEVLAAMRPHDLNKTIVNNGGDVAFHLTDDQEFTSFSPIGSVVVPADSPVRGIATSGWRGRSQSRGIADAVTVLADTAARADAAATLIANAVDLPDHPAITRVKAQAVEAIPQLGARSVTSAVGALGASDRADALDAGQRYAASLVANGLIAGAALLLQGETRVTGWSGIATRPVPDLS